MASSVPASSAAQAAAEVVDIECNSGASTDTSLKSVGGRAIFRKGGTLPTGICLSKAAIGAGVLSIAAHSAEVGFAYQFVCLIVGAILTVISIRMIADASVCTGGWSYEDICEELFHPAMSLFTGFINVCNCLGSGAGYLIVCGQVFQVLFGASATARNAFVIVVGVFVCGPLALVKHVGFMRHLAAISIAAILLLVVVVAFYAGEHGVHESVTTETFLFGPGGANVFTYMNAVNNVVFAYNNQFNVPQLTGELSPAPEVKRMTNVALLTTTLCFILYGGVSCIGTMAFGVGEDQKDSLVVDLGPERRNVLVFAALLAVMFSVLTCFQFHVYPIRQFMAYAARKARGRAAKDEEDTLYMGKSVTRWLDIASALTSVAVIILIAVVVTSLKTILDFVGAFASAYISYVVPPLWIIQLRRSQKNFSWLNREILFCLALLALGMFFFAFGTYSALADAIA